MTHPTLLQLSMLADGAMPAEEARALDAHVATCAECQTQRSQLQAETRYLTTAIALPDPADVRARTVPKFSRPVDLRGFALANIATALVIWLAQFLWKTLFGELIIDALSLFMSVYLPDFYSVASATTLYLLEEGTAMLEVYLGFIVAFVFVLTAVALWLRRGRICSGTLGVCLLAAVAGSLVMPSPVQALEIRRSDGVVVIPATETIDDTLLVAGKTVLIEGTVTGDVVAVGTDIDVSGAVGGNLVTFGDSVKVRGDVGGLLLGAASAYTLKAGSVGGDLWLAGESIDVDGAVRVNRNATLVGEDVAVAARIGKDLYAFVETLEVSGAVGSNLEVFGEQLLLLGDAHIAGDVRFRGDEEDLYRADTVRIDGNVEYPEMPEKLQQKNRYATVEFYLWQIAQLVAAFIVGLILLWLVPGMRRLSIAAGLDGLKSAGVGFMTLVLAPVAIGLLAFTLIGLPLALIVLFTWATVIYLAKIVLGAAVGRMLVDKNRSWPLPLFTGLAVLAVAVNLPFIGGIINFVLTIVGMGMLVQYIYALLVTRDLDTHSRV